MEKMRFITALVIVVAVCCVPMIKGRPSTDGKSTHRYMSAKKYKVLEWLHWFARHEKGSNGTDSFSHRIAFPSDAPDLPGLSINNSVSQFISETSPIYKCIVACFGDSNSVSLFHTCNRDCMFNPHKYDNYNASTDSDGDDNKREYSITAEAPPRGILHNERSIFSSKTEENIKTRMSRNTQQMMRLLDIL